MTFAYSLIMSFHDPINIEIKIDTTNRLIPEFEKMFSGDPISDEDALDIFCFFVADIILKYDHEEETILIVKIITARILETVCTAKYLDTIHNETLAFSSSLKRNFYDSTNNNIKIQIITKLIKIFKQIYSSDTEHKCNDTIVLDVFCFFIADIIRAHAYEETNITNIITILTERILEIIEKAQTHDKYPSKRLLRH